MNSKLHTLQAYFIALLHKVKNPHPWRKKILGAIVAAVLSFGVIYLIVNHKYVSTDDAYVNANVVQVSARVSGRVTKISVQNNQYVTKGQLLFELDQSPFKVSLLKAQAQLQKEEATLENYKLISWRTNELTKVKAAAKQDNDTALSNFKSAEASVALAKANLAQAELDLGYTQVLAPDSGWISNVTLREGDMINANQALFALVSDSQFWVDANFKETELKNIKPQQKAKVVVDMYPDHTFAAVVESISYGSGTAFSLLPAQNAVGNWIKVTQRIPVKVLILKPDPKYPLRIGSTATVTINTR
ncbi:MAG: HlyD family secretion protein [Gammaproteobacteria bacterium]